ncbi:GNAT family N-acetyltransferase [Alkalihalobacillus sp. NPDC078783]
MSGTRVSLRPLTQSDAEDLLALHIQNKHFFERFSMERPQNYYTLAFQEHVISQFNELAKQGIEYHFAICTKQTNQLVGVVDLFQLYRGPLQRGMIGYSVSQAENGKGYATEACTLLTEYAFTNLKLHRLEVAVMTMNHASIRVLEKSGFSKEGIAKQSVRVHGKWEDHYIYAYINPTH